MAIRTGRIDYVIQPNPVVNPASGQPYSPVIQYDRHRDTDYLIAQIAQRAAMSATTVKTVISALTEVIPKELSDGNIITITNFVSFRATLRGVTTDPDYTVTIDNAELIISARASENLQLATNELVTYRKLPYEERKPVIESFWDLVDRNNVTLTPGNATIIRGTGLKSISMVPPEVGLFIVDEQATPTTTKVTTVLKSTEGTFEFIPPEPAAGGAYNTPLRLEMRVVYTQRKDGTFGSLRTGTYTLN